MHSAPYCMLLYSTPKKGTLLRQGIPFFSMRTIPILIGWRLFRFFVINLQSARSCIRACVVFTVTVHVATCIANHTRDMWAATAAKEKKSDQVPRQQRAAPAQCGLGGLLDPCPRWSLFALAAPSRSLMDTATICSELLSR